MVAVALIGALKLRPTLDEGAAVSRLCNSSIDEHRELRRRHDDIIGIEIGDAGAAYQGQHAIDLVAINLEGTQCARLTCARDSMQRRAASPKSAVLYKPSVLSFMAHPLVVSIKTGDILQQMEKEMDTASFAGS